jgi:transcriptional regulator with XRE-family HTH domain
MTKQAVGGHEQWRALGEFIRSQRRLADLSLRQLADLARVSNPYLSQVERGLYRPSAQVLKGIADALDISAETLYAQAGLLAGEPPAEGPPAVEEAIRLDRRLSHAQKQALIQVYRGFVGGPEASS